MKWDIEQYVPSCRVCATSKHAGGKLKGLLQQGGQLKDMFGGIGPAVKAMGGYILGLVNPFTIAATAVGVLGLAYYQGSQEQDAFNKSLIMTGNLVGKTSGQLADIAARAGVAANSTTGKAASTLNLLVESGKVAADSLERVTTAVVKTSEATGISTDQLVGDFNEIAKDPVAAITKLNDQYHFLTLATYNQIKALQDEGNQQEAARVASEAYSSSMIQRSNQIKDNLGYLESAWNTLAGAAKGAWDAMLDIGREGTVQQKIADTQRQIDEIEKNTRPGIFGMGGIGDGGAQKKRLANLKQQLSNLQSEATAQDVLNDSINIYNQREQQRVKTQQEADRLNQQYLSNADKRSEKIKRQSELLKDGYITAEQYAKNVSRINEMYKDPKSPTAPKGKAYTEDAGSRLLNQLHEQYSVLQAQSDVGDKLNNQEQALLKWKEQVAQMESADILTAEQKSLLAKKDQISAQYELNVAAQREIDMRQQSLELDKFSTSLTRERSNKQGQYEITELASSGEMSDYDMQQYSQRLTLEQQLNDKITQLRQQRTSATTEIDRQAIDKEIAIQQDANAIMLVDYDQHIQRMNTLRGSFSAGVEKAWREYADSAADVSSQTKQVFNSFFSGMEDSLVMFVTTGKASFRDFANSIISDLARIAVRQAIVGIATGIFSMIFPRSSAGGSTPLGAYDNAANGLNFFANAKGGVYDSPSISSYSGGVYDSPNYFTFAKGAGVFGEAGPEAIMPLAKSPDGTLGVKALGNAGSSGNGFVYSPVNNIQIQNDGQNGQIGPEALKALYAIARKAAEDFVRQQMRDGGNLSRS